MTVSLAAVTPPTGGTAAASLRLLHERTAFSVFAPSGGAEGGGGEGSFDFLEPEDVSLDEVSEIFLDAGDVLVIRGDHSAFRLPPSGLAVAPMIYRFGRCEMDDTHRTFRSPLYDARLRLQRALLQRSMDSPAADDVA
eukprot:5512334-Prymnesium_polylepis.1